MDGGNEELLQKIQQLEAVKQELERKVESKVQTQDAEFANTLKLKQSTAEVEKLRVEMNNLRKTIAENATTTLDKDSNVYQVSNR